MSVEPASIEAAAEPGQSAEHKEALDSLVDIVDIAWPDPFGSAVDRTFSHNHGSVATRPTPASSIEECDRLADYRLASAYARQPLALELLRVISLRSFARARNFIVAYLMKNIVVVLGFRTRLDGFRSRQPLEQLAPQVLGLVERRSTGAGVEDR